MSSDDRQEIIEFDSYKNIASSPSVLLSLCVIRQLLLCECGVNRFSPSLQVGTQSFEWHIIEGQKCPSCLECSIALQRGKNTDICIVLPPNGRELFSNVNYMAWRIAVTVCWSRLSVVIIQQFAFLGLAEQYRVKSLTLCFEPYESHYT